MICSSDFSIAHGGRHDVSTNDKGKHHIEMAKACSFRSVASFFRLQAVSRNVIRGEASWAMFVVEHNLAFQSSDHVTKLFQGCFLIPK